MRHKCLLIHYFFPPIHVVASVRLYNIALHLENYSEGLWVITTHNRRFFPHDILPLDIPNLYQAYTFDFRTMSNLLGNKNIFFTEKTKLSRFARFSVKLVRSFPFNLLFGEGGLLYICHAFFISMKLIKQNKITTIFTSYSPYSDHFVAFLLKFFFPKLLWVADFRDLHVEPLYDVVFWRPFQHWCNKQILKKANYVTTISEGLAVHLRRYHKRVYVFKSGITLQSARNTPPQYVPKKQPFFTKFTISYTGSMYGNERDPSLFLKVVKDLVDKKIFSKELFQIMYAGKDTATWEEWISQFALKDYFVSRGMLSLKEAKDIQNQSHINLLLTSSTPYWTGVMTGKFYEYLAAQNPILVLINGTQDIEFESVIKDLDAGFLGYNDNSYERTRHFILTKFYEWQQTGRVLQTIHKQKLQEMTWASVVQKFIENVLEK